MEWAIKPEIASEVPEKKEEKKKFFQKKIWGVPLIALIILGAVLAAGITYYYFEKNIPVHVEIFYPEDTTVPLIEYGEGVFNETTPIQDFIFINVSVLEENERNISFELYNDSGLVDKQVYFDSRRNINWTDLERGEYWFNVTVFDLSDNFNSTQTYKITLREPVELRVTLITPQVTFNNKLGDNVSYFVGVENKNDFVVNVQIERLDELTYYNTTSFSLLPNETFNVYYSTIIDEVGNYSKSMNVLFSGEGSSFGVSAVLLFNVPEPVESLSKGAGEFSLGDFVGISVLRPLRITGDLSPYLNCTLGEICATENITIYNPTDFTQIVEVNPTDFGLIQYTQKGEFYLNNESFGSKLLTMDANETISFYVVYPIELLGNPTPFDTEITITSNMTQYG